MKKSWIAMLSLILVVTFAFTSLGYAATALKNIKLDKNNITLKVGQTYTLKVTLTPSDATDKKVTFTSSSTSIATVDNNGVIKAVKAGKAVIYATSTANRKITAKCNVTVMSDNSLVLNGISASQLDAISKETNLKKWDIAWGPTATNVFYDLSGKATVKDAIWRGGTVGNSVFADAGWGLILNTLESKNDDTPGAFIYNKTDVAAGMKKLQLIARCNTGDPALSEKGAFRVKAAYKVNGKYIVTTLKAEFSEEQLAQKDAALKQTNDGWVTFEVPPTIDKCDAFFYNISALAGKKDVVFFIEANDRMDKKGPNGTNLADRVIVLAVRLLDK